MDLLESLKQFEEEVAYRTLPPAGTPSFQHQIGARPVLISAPHATCHTRNGTKKMEEEFTYGVARHLAQATGAHTFLNRWEIAEDPNWDQTSIYKQTLSEITKKHDIQLVIDLHGMTNRHQIGVAVGTMNGRACPDHESMLEQTFVQAGFQSIKPNQLNDLASIQGANWQRLVMNHPRFTGGIKSHTVTRFVVDELNLPAVQIELTSSSRIPYRGPHDGWPFHYFGEAEAIQATMQVLTDFINRL